MNRITSLFGIQYPIIQAGMVWCGGWKLASAVSNAGGLGLIGSGSMSPEVLCEHIRKCKSATSKPFGVNVPLIYNKTEEILYLIIEEDVKIVFTSAGSPATWTGFLKEKGITVVHVVSSSKFAVKAQNSGVDAVVAEGFEAGGHNGREETTTLCLIPAVVDAVTIPVIAAGGIASGRAMLAAFALGAEGVQVGSAFASTEESSAHPNFKKAIIQAGEGDTKLSLKQLVPVRLLKNQFAEAVEEAEARGAGHEELTALLGKGRSRIGIFEGDLEQGELEIGQVSALLKEIKPAAVVLEQMLQEFGQVKEKIASLNI
jgi:enoyl-[acyl-carrier protein] reductase II